MEKAGEDSSDGSLEGKKLSNEIESSLKNALESAVGNCDYKQKTVLSAVIDEHLVSVDGENDIYVVDDENLEDELEEWSDRYS